MKIGIIGAGTVGTALAVRLASKGYQIEAVASRSFSSAERLAEAVSQAVSGIGGNDPALRCFAALQHDNTLLSPEARHAVPLQTVNNQSPRYNNHTSTKSQLPNLKTTGDGLLPQTQSIHIYDTPQGLADNADLVFITTPDDVIPAIANQTKWHPGQYVVHCSGADSLDVLEPARIVGAKVGSLHPLQTFAGIQNAIENLPGSTFALEAEGDLLDILKEMTAALEGRWIKLGAGDKAAYHAAAVMTSNYLVTLVKLATDLWDSFGIPREQATQALLPLLKGTINNIENLGIPKALTGPIARGDTGTVQIHLKALQQTAPAVIPAYCELGLQTIPVAVAKGKIDEHQAKELETILNKALKSNMEREAKCVQC